MLKKYFFIFLIVATFFSFNLQKNNAQETTSKINPNAEIIQYNLNFPGILPDNFLYKLKIFRDRVLLAMTSDTTSRINLLLKSADKGILASAMLVDKQSWKLAKETALKAEHNITLLTQEIYNLNEPIDQVLIKKLITASKKHQEVLTKLIERVPTDDQTVFRQVIDFSQRNQEEIEKFIEDK